MPETMEASRRLIRDAEFGDLLATGYTVEGTALYVLECVTFGFDYRSLYLLLPSRSALDRPDRAQLLSRPSRFGTLLTIGRELVRDDQGQLYFTLPQPPRPVRE